MMTSPPQTPDLVDCESVQIEILEFDEWSTLWRRCWARARSWRTPPRWSRSEWVEEARSQGALGAYEALHEYNPNRGVPRSAFLYQRVLTAVWTLYRREWRLGRRWLQLQQIREVQTAQFTESLSDLPDLLGTLTESERELLVQLYWVGCSETALAESIGISQQGLHKRKMTILRKLRSPS